MLNATKALLTITDDKGKAHQIGLTVIVPEVDTYRVKLVPDNDAVKAGFVGSIYLPKPTAAQVNGSKGGKTAAKNRNGEAKDVTPDGIKAMIEALKAQGVEVNLSLKK